MNAKSCAVAFAAIGWTFAPAAAADPAPPQSQNVRPPADPNQKVCEDITVVGSRLATKRICATRAEWAAQKQRDKEEVDRIQRSPCMPKGGTDTCDPGG